MPFLAPLCLADGKASEHSNIMHLKRTHPQDELFAGRLRSQQLKMVATLGTATVPAQMLCGLALAWSNRELAPAYCFCWCVSLLAICLIAMLRMRRNRLLDMASEFNLRAGTAVILITACLWGSFPLVMLTHTDHATDIDIVLAMVCLISGGSIVFQSMPVAATGWALVLTTCTLGSLWRDHYVHAWAISSAAVLFVSVLLRNIWMTHAHQVSSLHLTAKAEGLAQSLSHHAHIVQNTSIGVLLLDRAGCITWINDGVSLATGYSLQEAVGKIPSDWGTDEDRASLTAALRKALRSTNHGQAELRYQRKDGRWQWAQVDIKCMRDSVGKADCFVLVATEITELKHTAQALTSEQVRQSHIIDGTHCGTWEMDADGGVCKMGGHWLDIIGVNTTTPLVAEGSYLMDRIHPDDRNGQRLAIRQYLRGEVTQYVHEHRLRHENGSWHWVSARGKASAFGPDGRVAQMSGISMDISKSKATELALIEATRQANDANRAKSLFLATMSHEIRTPMNGVIGTAEWLKVTPLDEEQRDGIQTIVDSGRSLLTIIDDILDFTKVDAGRMKLEEEPICLVDLAEGVADAIGPVACAKQVDLHVFVDPQLPTHVMGDPTRLRQVLFNLAGNAVKFGEGSAQRRGQVDLQIVACDDGSPNWQVLVSDDGIGMSKEAISRLFTPFSQAEAATTRRFGGTGLGLAICHRLVELMGGGIDAHSVPGHGATFITTLPLLLPERTVEAREAVDLSGVDCVLVNGHHYRSDSFAAYLEHAGARTHSCSSLEAAQALAAEMQSVVLIRDTPVGAVQSFTKVADHVRHLLVGRDLHGPLRILSPHVGQLGRTHFQDLLRAVAVLAGRRSPEVIRNEVNEFEALCATIGARSDEGHDRHIDGRLILIAEDDPTNQKVIKRQMQILGFACEVVGDGQEAFEQWRSGRFDLLLSDLHMPEMDGYELAQRIRAAESEHGLPRTPMAALTANALKGEEIRAMACGMDAYLTKPISLKDLHQCLTQWLPSQHAGAGLDDPSPQLNTDVKADESCLDLDVLRALVGNDEDVIHELLQDFHASSCRIGERLEQSAASLDHVQIRKLAHQLKSAARSVGAHRLGQVCEDAETLAIPQDVSTEHVRALMNELHRVHEQLNAFIRESVK
jgi:PAS domain S-box-containing protein